MNSECTALIAARPRRIWTIRPSIRQVLLQFEPEPKSWTLNLKPEPPRPQTPNPKPQNPIPKTQTSNPKPQTPNPKPQTPNPKPIDRCIHIGTDLRAWLSYGAQLQPLRQVMRPMLDTLIVNFTLMVEFLRVAPAAAVGWKRWQLVDYLRRLQAPPFPSDAGTT